MEKKLQIIYLTYYNSLIVQDLWLAHYKILSLIFLKEFMELHVNSECTFGFLEYTNFKNDLIEYKCLCVTNCVVKSINTSLMKN